MPPLFIKSAPIPQGESPDKAETELPQASPAEGMVERVAIAVCRFDEPEADIWTDFTDAEIANYRQRARAAIEAMRTPTFVMKMAGAEAITIEHMRAAANYDAADDAWQAMLSTALSEKGA